MNNGTHARVATRSARPLEALLHLTLSDIGRSRPREAEAWLARAAIAVWLVRRSKACDYLMCVSAHDREAVLRLCHGATTMGLFATAEVELAVRRIAPLRGDTNLT
jgi:hypothetical protein